MDKVNKIGVITALTKMSDTSKTGAKFPGGKVRISAQFDFDPDVWYSSMTTVGIASRLKKGERVTVATYENNGFKNFDVVFGERPSTSQGQSSPSQSDDTRLTLITQHVAELMARVKKLEELLNPTDDLNPEDIPF